MSNRKFNFDKNFKSEFDKYIRETEDKLLAVVKMSIQDVVEEAQTPVAKGGKMRVDTGFLRASGVADINKLPVGPKEGEKRKAGQTGVIYEWDMSSSLQDKLVKLNLGDTLYFGWSARYALYRELYDGFLKSACDNWSSYVSKNIKEITK